MYVSIVAKIFYLCVAAHPRILTRDFGQGTIVFNVICNPKGKDDTKKLVSFFYCQDCCPAACFWQLFDTFLTIILINKILINN